jgi:ATP-binding cassette subfamily F protein uup
MADTAAHLVDRVFPEVAVRQWRNRLTLARLFTRPANVLVLDEPTNDLDFETLQLLEEQLLSFPGTILLVSHDRSFLDNVVTSMVVFEENELTSL